METSTNICPKCHRNSWERRGQTYWCLYMDCRHEVAIPTPDDEIQLLQRRVCILDNEINKPGGWRDLALTHEQHAATLQARLTVLEQDYGQLRNAICEVGTALGLIMPERVKFFQQEGLAQVQRLRNEVEKRATQLSSSVTPSSDSSPPNTPV